MNDKFCILPWIGIETSPIGYIKPCCIAKDELTDELGNKLHLSTTTLSEASTSAGMDYMRAAFRNGEQPETCTRCWREEDAGRQSKRQTSLIKFAEIIPTVDITSDTMSMTVIDLKLGNICNLKCRICGAYSSSKWAAEEMSIQLSHAPQTTKDDMQAYNFMQMGKWPRGNTIFWEDLDSVIPHIKFLEITGGEPFLIQEHYDFLERIIAAGQASEVELHYNTNATVMPDYALEHIWPKFKRVEIAFSIDGVGEYFEYQRYGAKWDEANNIIDTINAARKSSNIETQVCYTMSIFNVERVAELIQWIKSKRFNSVYMNVLHDPGWCALSQQSPEVSKYLNDVLTEQLAIVATTVPSAVPDIESLINFVNIESTNVHHNKYIKRSIEDSDKHRAESFSALYPTLAGLYGIE